jgi:predicted TIM-barrel fold metal-dependent hydrolase
MRAMAQPEAKRMVSADSHVIEPGDAFVQRVGPKFRDRVPRREARPDGDYIVTDGQAGPRLSGTEGAMGSTKLAGEPITAEKVYRSSDNLPGASDPVARLADQDLDHIRAEVVYPLMGLGALGIPDVELRCVTARAYNDWIAEFCSVAPNRLSGVGVLPLVVEDLELTIAEARRVRELGLGSALLPLATDIPYYESVFDPLWLVLEEIGLPIAFHTGSRFSKRDLRPPGAEISGSVANMVGATLMKTGLAPTVYELIWGTVPARYPRLRFVMTEGGIGWIAYVLRFMDHWWQDHRLRLERRLEEPPSTYFHRQFWATFEDDRPGILTLPLLNVDHLMWGSDYPHTEGTFPNSLNQVRKDLGDLPEDVRRKLVHDNAIALYGFR